MGAQWDIIEYAREKGLGAPHIGFPADHDPAKVAKIRSQLNKYDMRLVCLVRTPRTPADLPKYEAALQALSGMDGRVACVHDPFSGRRYEQFQDAAGYHRFFDACKTGVKLAEPLLRKYKLPLAIENHKAWRSAELADWVRSMGSEYVGVCLDLVNNVSLIETPDQTIDTLAPYTLYVSFKDIGVDFYDQGILLSEVPFGEGHLDLKALVARFQKKDPNMIFQIEMLTRDPLQVPIFTEQYWKVFDNKSPVPPRDLAMLIHYVRQHKPKVPLPRTTGLTAAQRLQLEDDCNQKCIDYARAHLPF
jgi:sugar phosphate isomerase/epimerase